VLLRMSVVVGLGGVGWGGREGLCWGGICGGVGVWVGMKI